MPIVWEGCEDIFNAPTQTLIVPVNMVGIAGKGLAKQFKERYPGWYSAYAQDCHTRLIRTEGYSIWRDPDDKDRVIYSMPTKVHWRDNSNLNLIMTSLIKLAEVARREELYSIAIPAIGCGEGKLDWDEDVYPLIKSILSHMEASIGIYMPYDPRQAQPEQIKSA